MFAWQPAETPFNLHQVPISTAECRRLTLEQGAYLPPGSEAALAGVLAQRRLQEEERDATEEEENKVRDEEDTWNQNHNSLINPEGKLSS